MCLISNASCQPNQNRYLLKGKYVKWIKWVVSRPKAILNAHNILHRFVQRFSFINVTRLVSCIARLSFDLKIQRCAYVMQIS